MNVDRSRPLSYRIYDFLKENAVGYDNRVKGSYLMSEFEIDDNKTLRSYIEEVRDNETLQKIICSESGKKGGYWVATNDDEVLKTLEHLYKRSLKMLETYSKIKKKYLLNNQTRIKFTENEKGIFVSIMEGENEKTL